MNVLNGKRVAFVSNTAWNIFHFRILLIKELQEIGCHIVGIAPDDEYKIELIKIGCDFIPLQYLKRMGTNPWQDMKLKKELRWIYQREEIDVALHFTIKPNIYGSLASHTLQTKSFCTVTGLGYTIIRRGMINSIVRALYKYAFHRADIVAFQNHDDRNQFISKGLIPSERARIIPGSGVDTGRFKPTYIEEEETEDNKFVFLFIGRLLYDKGIVEFLKAADLLNKKFGDMEFWIVGEPDHCNPSSISKAEWERWTGKNEKLRHFGKVKDVRTLIARCDCVVLPSYREGMPRVLLEGMSMAKPIIATDVPGCREAVQHGENGYLVKVKNSMDLAGKMVDMYILPVGRRKAFGDCGRKRVIEKFDSRKVNRQYVTILSDLVRDQ